MLRIIIPILFIFSFNVFANANSGDTLDIEQYKCREISLKKLSSSLDSIYNSASIWWVDPSSIPDSIRNIKYPEYSEQVYSKRIHLLSEKTPINLEYNEHVQKYIEAYLLKNKDKLKRIMGKSAYYFPIFEECLSRYGLPLELKYLAAVESALDPNAVSVSGAVGLWQIMKPTANVLDLNITSYIDERRDVYKSTEAACKYLKQLFNMFGDWQLAMVAYNGGPGTVTKAMARYPDLDTYWELRPHFTKQMQNYVPAFIAMTYLMEYQAEHNIFPDSVFYDAMKIDTLMVQGPIRLKDVALFLGMNFEDIKSLNPTYTHAYIPADNDFHALVIPKEYTSKYLMKGVEENDEDILKKALVVANNLASEDSENKINIDVNIDDTTQLKEYDYSHKVIRKDRDKIIYHTIKDGDNLYKLSLQYDCSIDEIKKWNNMGNKANIYVGSKLKFYVE